MYGGSGKLGRGTGGGRGSKRNNHSPFPPPPLHRSIPPNTTNRLSIGASTASTASRNRNPTTSTPSTAPSTTPEETFNLISGNPLAFAMIIRLAPNLVDEVRRVESEGGIARIKFDSNANNPAGNVIDVGGKDFRFTWSHEPGDLCDIYEERQSGENGSGLLVESGGAWRKLNVQRVLDESTKNHVKMRSEEAERKLKSRKAIVLDHGNPSVNNQMKTLATAAVEGRMTSKPKKEPPFKKRKVEPPQAIGGPLKSVFKSVSSATTAKGRLSISPVPSPPEQSGASASPFGVGNLTNGQTSVEDVTAPQVARKEERPKSEKEMRSRAVHTAVPMGNKKGLTASPMDLQSMLITLLMENRKGMSLKALEKAVGDTIPNSARKIEPIIKKIAIFQAPGRYILRPGVDLESFKKPSSDSGSSPECIRDQTATLEKPTTDKFEQQSRLSPELEVSNLVEQFDTQHNSPDLFGDKKVSDHSEERAYSSSESGSDSDSASDSGSESGSDSGSQSRSAAGSGSSSDSESDGTSSNKEASDVDVDIMTSGDEKEETKHKLQNPEPRLSTSPVPWKTDGQNELNGVNEDKQAGHVFIASKESPNDDRETEMVEIIDSVPIRAHKRSSQETMPFSPDLNQQGESQQFSCAQNFINGTKNMKESVGLEHHDSLERISSSKMSSGLKYFDEKSESAKRMKGGSLTQPLNSVRNKEAIYMQSPKYLSSDKPPQDMLKDRTMQVMDRVGDGTVDTSSQKGHGSAMPGRSVSDAQHSDQRYADLSVQGNAPDVMERSRKHGEYPGRGIKNFEKGPIFQDESDGSILRSMHVHDKFTTKDEVNRVSEDCYANEKFSAKNVRQGVIGDRTSMPSKSQYRKQGEQVTMLKDAGQMAHSHNEVFPKDDSRTDIERPPMINGKGSSLRRELSDLELGEFREPSNGEEIQGVKKKFEKKNSFKLSGNNSNALNNLNIDSNKGRTAGKMIQDSRKQSSPDFKLGVSSNQEELYMKRIAEDDNEKSMRPQQTISLPQDHQLSRVDHADTEVGFELDKTADKGTKPRKNKARKSQGMDPESYEGTSKKTSVNVPQQHGVKHEGRTVGPKIIKENKSQKSNAVTQLNDRKDNFWKESSYNSQKRRESSSDEDNCAYLKYEKDEPELKGPIKDFSQYKEYVQEYREKYSNYHSLNKSLKTYRMDFSKLGHDLQLAKERDMDEYFNILEQLKETYRQCGTMYKRLKKIFVVLHEELQHLKQRIKDFAIRYTKD